ncbi:TM2 domain-containing protein [Mycobacterium tilburgii]|uniref:TM2 domain-containing protein n=1 Tax=Mycobacterium tilburgii TaxID=44467 RepID=UPI0011833DCE|nr:TM2 domain-containing protein [Mycobacterium tilburgii]
MTDPSWSDAPDSGTQPQQPPGSPPYSAAAPRDDPWALYGRHPLTGLPYSDKSKTIAGLLQMLSMVGIGGIGRCYIGDIGMGVAQLLVGLLTCGVGLIWSIVDAVLMLTDKVNDPQGQPLRDGI